MLKLFVMFCAFLGFIYVLSSLEQRQLVNSKHQIDTESHITNHELAYPVVNEVKAYNDRNISDFVNCFAKDFRLYKLQSGELICDGRDDFFAKSNGFFKSNSNSQIIVSRRFICGKCVIDERIIREMNNNKQTKSTAIFEIKDDLIANQWIVDDNQ